MATIIFLGPSLRFWSVTLVQKTATKITGKILDDYIIITTGKLVNLIAIIDRTEAEVAARPVKAAFISGILTFSLIMNLT